MEDLRFEFYWQDIPVGKENAVSYAELCEKWKVNERQARKILSFLSSRDNGDDYILVRSARYKGFYKTDDLKEITAYKEECLNRGRSIFRQLSKMNRVINADKEQFNLSNNLRVIRELKGLKQADVCLKLQQYDKGIDTAMLSKMENNVCLPTPKQVSLIAEIYGCNPQELIFTELYL